jgi:hypothetical protein
LWHIGRYRRAAEVCDMPPSGVSDERPLQASVLIGFVALIAACALELSGPQRLESIHDVKYDLFQEGGLRLDSLLLPTYPSVNLQLHTPRVKRTLFQSRMNRQVRANCLPSGLRADFCHRYGQLDQSPTLFSVIPSCRRFNFTQYIGGCRPDRDRVVDYCITTDDVNWELCRQKPTECVFTSIATEESMFVVANTSAPDISVPLDVTLTSNVTNFVVDLLVFARADSGVRTDIKVVVASFNRNFSLNTEEAINVRTSFAGYVPVKIEFSANSTVLPLHITSIELLLFGLTCQSSIIVEGVYISSCSYGIASFTILAPVCMIATPQFAGTSYIDLNIPLNISSAAKQTRFDEGYSGGLLFAPVAPSSVLQIVESSPYTLLLITPLTASSTFNLSDIYTPGVVKLSDNETRRIDEIIFASDVAYYRGSLSVNTSHLVVLPTILLSTLRIGWYYPLHMSIKFYSVEYPECLSNSTIRFDETVTDRIVLFTDIAIPTSALLYDSNRTNASSAYLEFGVRRVFTVADDVGLVSGPKFCVPVYYVTPGTPLDPTYFLALNAMQNIDGMVSLTMPLILTGNPIETVLVLVTSIWDLYFNLGSSSRGVFTDVYITGFICVVGSNTSTVNGSFLDIRSQLANTSKLYAPTPTTYFTGSVVHPQQTSKPISLYKGTPTTATNAYLNTYPHPVKLPSVISRACVLNGLCLVPYNADDVDVEDQAGIVSSLYVGYLTPKFQVIGAVAASNITGAQSPLPVNYQPLVCSSPSSFFPFGAPFGSTGITIGLPYSYTLLAITQLTEYAPDIVVYSLCPDQCDSRSIMRTLFLPKEQHTAYRNARSSRMSNSVSSSAEAFRGPAGLGSLLNVPSIELSGDPLIPTALCVFNGFSAPMPPSCEAMPANVGCHA